MPDPNLVKRETSRQREEKAPPTTTISELNDLELPPLSIARQSGDFVLRTEVVAAKLKLNDLAKDLPWGPNLSYAIENVLDSIFLAESGETEGARRAFSISCWYTNVVDERLRLANGEAILSAILEQPTPHSVHNELTAVRAISSIKNALIALGNGGDEPPVAHFPLLTKIERDNPLARAKQHLSDAVCELLRLGPSN